MILRVEKKVPPIALAMLRHCYQFVNKDWQHVERDESADQGFEVKLRESCVTKLTGWVVSQHREMNLGTGYGTASGVLHEIDIVVQNEPAVGILELKNRPGWPPEKNDVIVFFAKILDYLCLTPALLRSCLVPIFVSSYAFERSGLAACLGLGIHPIAPQLRPLPILIDNAKRMHKELETGVKVPSEDEGAFDDFCSQLNRMSNVLAGAEVNTRFTCLNDSSIAVHAFGDMPVSELADELRALNGECARLLEVFRTAKGALT
jgi:hypothetical protein